MKRAVALLTIFVLVVWDASAQLSIPPQLRPPHGELPPSLWDRFGGLVMIGLILYVLAVAIFLAIVLRTKKRAIESAASVARRALESWRARAEDGVLISDVSRVLRRYVMAAFNFPSDELTTTEFRAALKAHPQIRPELATAAGDFLRVCDEWKFAPAPPALRLGAVETALDLVNRMESSQAPVPAQHA